MDVERCLRSQRRSCDNDGVRVTDDLSRSKIQGQTLGVYLYAAFAIIPMIVYANVITQANAQRQRTETVVFGLKPELQESGKKQ